MLESLRSSPIPAVKATTVLCVRRNGQVVMGCDGQVTFASTVLKATARKVQRLHEGKVLAGFAGSSADGLSLLERFESKLEEHRGNLKRAAVELAKAWRTEKYLRHLEAHLLVADQEHTLVLTGTGDVIEPDHGVVAIGSGGTYAMAAGRALYDHTDLSASQIAEEAMKIASQICIYTNEKFLFEALS